MTGLATLAGDLAALVNLLGVACVVAIASTGREMRDDAHADGALNAVDERDTASVRANVIVTFARGEVIEPYRTMGGVYDFGARRTDDGWLLTRIETRPTWQTGTR